MIDRTRQDAPAVTAPMPECWRVIGVAGDRSCPELQAFVHCRNCPVLAEAARSFFDRPAPEGYLDAWQAILEEPAEAADGADTSVLVFRVDHEWLSLPTGALVEVTPSRTLHTVPHRAGTALAGIVNVRGQLQLCVSLHAVLGLPGGPQASAAHPGGPEDGAGARANRGADGGAMGRGRRRGRGRAPRRQGRSPAGALDGEPGRGPLLVGALRVAGADRRPPRRGPPLRGPARGGVVMIGGCRG